MTDQNPTPSIYADGPSANSFVDVSPDDLGNVNRTLSEILRRVPQEQVVQDRLDSLRNQRYLAASIYADHAVNDPSLNRNWEDLPRANTLPDTLPVHSIPRVEEELGMVPAGEGELGAVDNTPFRTVYDDSVLPGQAERMNQVGEFVFESMRRFVESGGRLSKSDMEDATKKYMLEPNLRDWIGYFDTAVTPSAYHALLVGFYEKGAQQCFVDNGIVMQALKALRPDEKGSYEGLTELDRILSQHTYLKGGALEERNRFKDVADSIERMNFSHRVRNQLLRDAVHVGDSKRLTGIDSSDHRASLVANNRDRAERYFSGIDTPEADLNHILEMQFWASESKKQEDSIRMKAALAIVVDGESELSEYSLELLERLSASRSSRNEKDVDTYIEWLDSETPEKSDREGNRVVLEHIAFAFIRGEDFGILNAHQMERMYELISNTTGFNGGRDYIVNRMRSLGVEMTLNQMRMLQLAPQLHRPTEPDDKSPQPVENYDVITKRLEQERLAKQLAQEEVSRITSGAYGNNTGSRATGNSVFHG